LTLALPGVHLQIFPVNYALEVQVHPLHSLATTMWSSDASRLNFSRNFATRLN